MSAAKAKKSKMRVRRGDNVVVISGRDKGKTGEVLRVDRERNRILVQGVNMVKRHQRQKDERNPAGIIEKEMPIHVSNVKLICRACEKPTRVRFRVRTDNVKVRVCRSCDQDID